MSIIITVVLWILAILIGVLVITAVTAIIYARWNYGILETLGIPVIKPHWFLGSNWNAHNYTVHEKDIERSQKYGHVYGVYDGRTPTVYISDPELIKVILVKDFDHFRNHRPFMTDDQTLLELLDFLNDEKWKTVRSALTPSFTTGKIKQMSKTVCEKAEEYVAALVKECGEEKSMKINFRTYCAPLILDIIGRCFCGIEIDNPRDPDNKFIQTLRTTMGPEVFQFDWTFTLSTALPILQKFMPFFPKEGMTLFQKTMKTILKGREDSGIKQQDMVNTLLEICRKAKTDPEYKKLGITESTAMAQAFEFFIASYEGIRGTFTMLTYHLASNPDINKKLLEEVDFTLKKNGGVVTDEGVADMPYLTACLTETMRITPAFFRLDRVCNKDWEHNGVQIKKGVIVTVPLYAVHNRSDIYEEPRKFDPERFMPENKDKIDPYAFITFGHGPRACIGQRFAFECLKIILTNYLKEFRIEKRSDTQFTTMKGSPVVVQFDPIYVDFVRRN